MKKKSSLRSALRCRNCKTVRRGKAVLVICTNPKHKAKQGS